MKVFGIVLLCAFAAVQGRGIDHPVALKNAVSEASPWLVHLRIAVATSGLLDTCLGVLIDPQWVLTSSACASSSRFIWIRYGAVNVVNPLLVTETSVTDANQNARWNGVIAVVRTTRYVEPSEKISPVAIGSSVPLSANFCHYVGQDGQPGEVLVCSDISLSDNGDGIYSSDANVNQFDLGAPLVDGGEVSAILINANGYFTEIASHLPWINEQTGLTLGQ